MKPRRNVTHTHTHTRELRTQVVFFLLLVRCLSDIFVFLSPTVVAGAHGELCGCVDMSWLTAQWVSWAWGGSVSIFETLQTIHAHYPLINCHFCKFVASYNSVFVL